jgi:hypothetical protein
VRKATKVEDLPTFMPLRARLKGANVKVSVGNVGLMLAT